MIKTTPAIHYPEGAAPFGEQRILVPEWEKLGDNLPADVSVECGALCKQAWAESEWLGKEIGEQKVVEWFSDAESTTEIDVTRMIIRSFYRPREVVALAVAPLAADMESEDMEGYLDPSQITGFANGKQDVSGNTSISRALKRTMRPDKIYGCVSNINVRPEKQGSRLGIALFDAVLRNLPDDKKATVYVARSNDRLIQSLGKYGYYETGSGPRQDIIANACIEEARLMAESVAEVRERLAEDFSWLRDAEYSDAAI